MGKSKKKGKGAKKTRIKKSFLDNQKRKKAELKNKTNQKKGEVLKYEKSFKFETFSDQIATTDYSIVYQLAGKTISQETTGRIECSVFHSTLNHWAELNQAADFTAALRSLRKYVTLPQVVYSCVSICDILRNGLRNSTPLSVQPFLELTAGLATDLQHEFFPQLSSFTAIMMEHVLVIKNSDVIKWTFRCLSHLLKILWRPISQDLEQVFSDLCPLFSNKRPDYIRYMAAETMAFLFRKSKNKKDFAQFMLSKIGDELDPVAFSKLFFESVKTINCQFNLYLEPVLDILLNIIPEQGDHIVLTKFIQFCCEHTDSQNVRTLQNKLFNQIRNDVTKCDIFIECVDILIQTEGGQLVKDLKEVLSLLNLAIKGGNRTRSVFSCLNNLLVMPKIERTSESYEEILNVMLKSDFPRDFVCDVMTQLRERSEFDTYFLKPYLAWVQINLKTDADFDSLCEHVCDMVGERRSPCDTGSDLEAVTVNTYDLNLVPSLRKLKKEELFLNSFVSRLEASCSMTSVHCSLVVCSVLVPINKKLVLDNIINLINTVMKAGAGSDKLQVLPDAVETLCMLLPRTEVASHIDVNKVISLYLSEPGDYNLLKLLDFTLTVLTWNKTDQSALSDDQLLQLFNSVSCQLSAWDPAVRQLALHALSQIVPKLGSEYVDPPEENHLSLLQIIDRLLQAERTDESLSEYKNKINVLRNLEAERLHSSIREDAKFVSIVVKYLLGSLYTNLTLLWAPLEAMLAGFATAVKPDMFWQIFVGQLKDSSDQISLLLNNISQGEEEIKTVDGRKVDFIKYRNRLWLLLDKFADLAEQKNRSLVPIFLDSFLNTEYTTIRKLSENKSLAKEYKEVISSTVSSLTAHLTIFSHFKNLSSLHRSEEMLTKVEDLLCHRVASVQKVSLNILVAFKLKYVHPYKENLERMLDDREFKKELLEFPLNEESTNIKSEHRDHIIPIILRLLYGRMRSAKRGKDGGKGSMTMRRTQILHYIMELSEQHIRVFLNIIFKDLYIGCDLRGKSVYEYIEAGQPAPVRDMKQLQAILDTIQAIMSKLGRLMKENLGYLLETIVWIGFIVDSVYRESGKIAGCKSVRNSVYSQLATFYTKFSTFNFTAQIEQIIFRVFVWRPLVNFENDYIHSPSGLLHLVTAWSKIPQFHRYFLINHPTTHTPMLHNITKVLLKNGASTKVINAVLQVVDRLVAPGDEEELKEDDEPSPGVQAVLKEMENLVTHFNTWISGATADTKAVPKRIGVKLDILRNLSPYITDAATAGDFIRHLLILMNSVKKSVTICKVLVIVEHLSSKILEGEVERVMDVILPLYSRLNTREEILQLSKLMKVLKSKSQDFERLCDMCINLTSYDPKRVEEPDFESRMNQMIRIRELVRKEEEFSVHELTALVYVCCQSLSTEKDSSLKSNCLDTLLVLCRSISKKGESEKESMSKFVNKVPLEIIRLGIKTTKDDTVRCDLVHLLQKLVEECSQLSARLADLSCLSFPLEPEIDFFENIRHVQMHRRGRAVIRLTKQIQENPKMLTEKNLVQLILPLVSCYLLDPAFQRQSALVEQTIVLLGAICSVLSWQSYETYIKYYLGLFKKEKMNQKQLVKITIQILNAFHFPLNMEEPGLSDKEMKLRQRINTTVNCSLLPSLTNMLASKTKGKVSVVEETDDDLILRVPLAVPIVRILQLNSAAVVEQNIPGIISKIASFLKSKAIEIRQAARATLNSIMELLGPRFISFVIKDLASVLTRGYQVHVLTFTVHHLLHNMMDRLQPGDLDSSIQSLTEIAINEMFGVTAEEKEVKKITGKLMEAKNTKSYDTLQIAGKFVAGQHILNLVKPFSDKLATFSTFKNISKIKECLRNIAMGMLENTSLEPMLTVTFIYAVLTDNLNLVGQNKPDMKKPVIKKDVVERPDSYLIAPEPKRGGLPAKNTSATSKHVLHEFGLNLLYFVLKRGLVESSNPEHCSRIDPFFQILLDFLDSAHATVISVTLRCFIWIVKLPLESRTSDNLVILTDKVFSLLRRYGGGTDCKGENQDLVMMASKLLVVLVRDVKLTKIKDDQLKIVFEYILLDVLDPVKQTTAFGLLNAVLNRKIVHENLHELMLKLAEMSVQSESDRVRQCARSAITNYVGNYSLKKKLSHILDFYVAQLSYQFENGRLAAAETLKSLLKSLGPDRLSEQAQFLFVSMAPQLSNAESEDTRKGIAMSMGALLSSVHPDTSALLLRTTMSWFQASSLAQVQLACRILIIFIDTLGFKSVRGEVGVIVSKLNTLFNSTDGLLIQVLMLIQKIVRNDSTHILLKNRTSVEGIQGCLLHPHTWVRLLAAQLVGQYLVAKAKVSSNLTWLDQQADLKSVILDTLEQLNLADSASTELKVQVVKNLVALTKIIPNITAAEDTELLSQEFVLKKAIKLSNQELVNNPKVSSKRTLVFNYLAAICMQMNNIDKEILEIVLTPLVREISITATTNTELKTHAQEVMDMVKSKVDDEMFSKTLLAIQLRISKVRGERSAKKKQNLIKNPQVAAKRKLQRNEARKSTKKPRRF